MKIYSDFRDYYDTIQYTLGKPDDTVKYYRNTSIITAQQLPLLNKFTHGASGYRQFRGRSENMYIAPFIIGFAGQLHVGLDICDWTRTLVCDKEIHRVTTYDLEEVKKVYEDEIGYFRWKTDHLFKEFLPKIEQVNLFLQYKVPVFAIARGYTYPTLANKVSWPTISNDPLLIVNPQLDKSSVDFITVKDPFTAYQELEQFISMQLTDKDPQPRQLTDKEKIVSHGFDVKSSFRKEKKK